MVSCSVMPRSGSIQDTTCGPTYVLPAAVRCDMVLHQAFRARRARQNGIGGEVRHGVTSI